MAVKDGDGIARQLPTSRGARLATLKYADLEDWRKDNEHIYQGHVDHRRRVYPTNALKQATILSSDLGEKAGSPFLASLTLRP